MVFFCKQKKQKTMNNKILKQIIFIVEIIMLSYIMYSDSKTQDNGKRAIGKGKVGNRATIDRLLRYGLSLKVTFDKMPKVCVTASHINM